MLAGRSWVRPPTSRPDLALNGDLEALKRALFLQWYALFEPACFTGLWEMDESCELRVLMEVDRRVADGRSDEELDWMLHHFYTTADYHIDRFPGLDSAKRRSTEREGDWWPPAFVRESLRDRGQMGTHFASMNW